MIPTRRLLLCATALTLSCVDAPPASPGLELRFAALDGGCQKTTNGSNTVPDSIDTLVAVIRSADGSSKTHRIKRSAVAGTGSWLIKGIAVADDLDIELYGCDAAGAVTYAGQSNGAAIESQQETSLRAFLVPVGKLACTGDAALPAGSGDVPSESAALPQRAALGAATPLASGDVLVSGGLGEWTPASQQGVATRETALYDHQTGHFRRGPLLRSARLWHHAIALTPTRVLVVGGVSNAKAIGSSSGVATPVLVPNDIAKAVPADAAEVVDTTPDAQGQLQPATASPADVGAGKNPLSSAVRTGDTALFVGGVDAKGAAVAAGTRLSGLNDVADGKSGTTTAITVAVARIRPGLVTLDDGRVLIWGGAASGKAEDMGEVLDKGADKTKKLKIGGDNTLLSQATLATAAPAVALVSQSASQAVLLVTGGMPFSSPLSAAEAPSYLVVFDRGSGEATLKPLTVGGSTLHGGLGTTALRLPDGRLLVAGGLVALSGVAPCDTKDAECLLSQALVLDAPTDVSTATVDLKASASLDLGGGQLGMAAAPLPMGALLAGGLSAVVRTLGADEKALTHTGRVVVGSPSADICAP